MSETGFFSRRWSRNRAGRMHHEVVISQGLASPEPRLTTVCRNVNSDFARDLVVRSPCRTGPLRVWGTGVAPWEVQLSPLQQWVIDRAHELTAASDCQREPHAAVAHPAGHTPSPAPT